MEDLKHIIIKERVYLMQKISIILETILNTYIQQVVIFHEHGGKMELDHGNY